MWAKLGDCSDISVKCLDRKDLVEKLKVYDENQLLLGFGEELL